MLSQVASKYRNCRYCNKELTIKNLSQNAQKALVDVCNSTKCQKQAKEACNKMLACGHPCPGLRNDLCMPCLNQACCRDKADMTGQKGKDYCKLCST